MTAPSAPVIVMRWFATGSAYAFSPTLDDKTRGEIATVLKPVFQGPAPKSFRVPLADGRLVVGDKFADDHCLDDKAKDRDPYIVRAVVLPPATSSRTEQRAAHELRSLVLPTRPGPQALGVTLPAALAFPDFAAGGSRIGPWVILTLLLMIDALTQFAPAESLPMPAWFCRVAGLLAAVGVYFLATPSRPGRDALLRLERDWAGELSGGSLAQKLEEGTVVVLPTGGAATGRSLAAPMTQSRPQSFPTAASDQQYDGIECNPGVAIVRGTEVLQFGSGAVQRCRFLRVYGQSRRGLELVQVQWTAIGEATR